MSLNFLALPQRFRPSIKRICYALLSLEAPDGEKAPSVMTIRSYFSEFKRFLKWLNHRWSSDQTELSEISPQDLDA